MNTRTLNVAFAWKHVFILLFFLTAISGFSQNLELIRDLKKQLENSNDQNKISLLNQLAWEYRSAFPDSAILYAARAQTLSHKLSETQSTAISLNYIGLSNYYKGNFIRAFEFYEQALREATLRNDSIQLAHANNNIGRLFSDRGMLTQAYPYFVKAQLLFESLNDSSGLAYVYQSFGALFKTQKDFVRSELNYQNAYKIRLSSGNTRDIMSAMIQLGKLYVEIGQYDDALLYFHKADSAGEVIHDALGLAEIKILTAEYHLGKGHLDEAEALCTEGLSYVLGSKNVKLVPNAYLVLGEVNFKKQHYAVAKKYFSIALNVSEYMKYLDYEMQAHYFLWKLSEIAHNRADELFHSNKYLVLKDSIHDNDLSQKIAQFQFQLEIERKQQENELLKSEEAENEAVIRNQNLQRIVLITTLIFISVLLFLQWRNSKRRKTINEALTKHRDQIESQREEIKKQLSIIEEKHAESLVREEEKKKINIQLSEKVAEISQQNTTLENHLTTLLDFSKSKRINYGNIEDAARDIARITAESLSISRVSIWRYHAQTESIESIACYSLIEKEFKGNTVLSLSDYPQYAFALQNKKIINADAAREHPDTHEFTNGYLVPLDIHSMLDVTFSLDDGLGGLLCCEQQINPRVWSSEDIIFARSVSDIVSLTYRSAQRREYEKNIRQHSKEIARMNETLEQRVRERTEELQNRYKQLTEYAFINSHLLRSPVSRILGLINLLEMGHEQNEKEVIAYLKQSCLELDIIVKKITSVLETGDEFSRKAIETKNPGDQ